MLPLKFAGYPNQSSSTNCDLAEARSSRLDVRSWTEFIDELAGYWQPDNNMAYCIVEKDDVNEKPLAIAIIANKRDYRHQVSNKHANAPCAKPVADQPLHFRTIEEQFTLLSASLVLPPKNLKQTMSQLTMIHAYCIVEY
jgi:hypothetical protein